MNFVNAADKRTNNGTDKRVLLKKTSTKIQIFCSTLSFILFLFR